MPQTTPYVEASKRYRLFFDETGNGDLRAAQKDPNQRYLSLTGIAIRQDLHDSVATDRLTALKAGIFGKNLVLHRREIIDAKGDFGVLREEGTRARFNAQFLTLVGELSRPAFTVSIDKQEHLEKYKVWQFSPYHYALTCLLERFVLWLHYSNYRGDVRGEARGPKHDAQLRRAFHFFYKHGTAVTTSVIQDRLISRELAPNMRDSALKINPLPKSLISDSFRLRSSGRVEASGQLPSLCPGRRPQLRCWGWS
jgi:hypothetical protein